MRQKLSLVTLGVADVDKAAAFYASLGWRASSASHAGEFVLFDVGGVILGLYKREALADDAQMDTRGSGFSGVALAFNARSKAEVDEVLKEVASKGGKLVKPAQDVFWGGYSGYFSDPDGHLFEVAYNPFWELDEAGAVKLPK